MMQNSAFKASALLGRHHAGRPLFTMKVAAHELDALRAQLSDAVAEGGIEALRAPALARLFVVYAAEALCRESQALRWRPILQSLGVEPDDAARYVGLYDHLESALRTFERRMIVRLGARRFLATLLREGGLPVHIGNLPDLVRELGRDMGWETLAGPEGAAVRRFAVQRIRALAQGRLREILDVEEAVEALEDLLADAASTRDRLARCGIDPTTLATSADVQRALEAHGIELPGARDDKLLSAILASFREAARTSKPTPSAEPGGLLELRARVLEGRQLELRALLHLGHPGLRAALPEGVTFATVAVEPGGPARLIQRTADHTAFESDDAAGGRLEWRADVTSQLASATSANGPEALTLVVRANIGGGAPLVATLAHLEMPDQPLRWFDGEGRLLPADELVLASGQRRLLWARDQVRIETSGDVTARELSVSAGSGWLFTATGEGAARVLGSGGQELGVVECRKRLLAVTPTGALPSRLSRATHAVERLPDLVLGDASTAVDMDVSLGDGAPFQPIVRGEHGLIRLSAIPSLRNAFGAVRVRLSTRDGRTFRARWTVIPPHVIELVDAQRVVFADKRIVHAAPTLGTSSRLAPGRFQLEAPAGVREIDAELMLDSGDVVRVRVRLGQRWVRLWHDILARDEAPLDGSALLTEAMVFAHACLEAQADSDREVWLEDEGGTRLVTSRTDRRGRALVPLRDVLRHKLRLGESTIMVIARVDGDPAPYRFKILVPRMARPTRLTRPVELVLEVVLDERDVPTQPALACFDVLRPFDEPAIVPCALTPAGPRSFSAAIAAEKLPTSRGRWIVLLVDAALHPVRSCSGALLVEIPLDVPAVRPHALPVLEEGLWNLDESKILDALDGMAADLPAFELWLERFVNAVRARAGLGLGWFYLFEIIVAQAPWIVLAAASRLPPRARFAWLDLYRAELRGFSWLGFARSARHPLARVLHRQTPEEITALVEVAKQAFPMPRAIELAIYQEALSERAGSAQFFDMLIAEMCGTGGRLELPRDWHARLAIPNRDLHEAAAEGGLRGRRAAALTQLRWGASLTLLQGLPDAWLFRPRGLAPCAAPSWIEAEARAKGVSTTGHAGAVIEAEQRVAEAAHLLTLYREQGARLSKDTWRALRELERSVPDLLDVWLLALGKD